MKKIITMLMVGVMVFNSIYVSAYKYAPPYNEVDGGRAAENMPDPFNLDTAIAKILIASDDFDGESTDANLSRPALSEEKEYADGAIKISKTQSTDALQVNVTYTGEILDGETYAFYSKIKTENVLGAAPVNLIQAYGKNGWLKEAMSSGKKSLLGTNEWTEIVQIIEIPEGTTRLELAAYMPVEATGTVWFDDFKLYHIAVDPLEAVLVRPNYKGLIYGDGFGDIDLDLTIGERTNYFELEDMEVSVRLIDENDNVYRTASVEEISSRMNFVFSSNGLPQGDYYLQTILSDKGSGAVISKKEQTIRKRSESYKPDTYLDENGRIIKNGEKTFLKRIYNSGGDYPQMAEDVKTAGIDTVSWYDLWWALTQEQLEDTEDMKNALSYMRDNAITTNINLDGYFYGKLTGNASSKFISKQEDILPFLTNVVNDHKDDSVLEGYYVFDEPNPVILGEEIRWNNEILAQEDINHPTFGVADGGYGYYGIYTKMTDILGIDPYPVRGKTDSNGNPADDLSTVGKNVREVKENFPNRPVYLVLQGFRWEGRGDLRGPTEPELKNMAWQAICEGVDGLDWYSYSSMMKDTVETNEQWLNKLNNVFSDIRGYEDVILSDEPVPNYSVTGGGDWLNLTLRRRNGKTYLFAVNNTYSAKSAVIDIEGNSTQNLSFDALEVKKIELEQADFLSPEAELITMGFSNGNETFPVAEGEKNILYVNSKSGVINYNAKISNGAKLYIGNREMPENGKITVKYADSFEVRIVAENGVNTFSKIYQIIKK